MSNKKIWTNEQIEVLTDNQIRTLAQNAIRLKQPELANQCQEVLLSRGASSQLLKKNIKMQNHEKSFANTLAEKMGIFAIQLNSEVDLSKETARNLSSGIKGFVAHSLIDSKGRAKVGGAELNGALTFDRILTYRIRNMTVGLNVFLEKGKKIEDVRYQVSGPKFILVEGLPIQQSGRFSFFRPRKGTEEDIFQEYNNLEEALENYKKFILKMRNFIENN